MTAPVVLRGVSVGTALCDVGLVIQPGACVGVLGVNGSGKSTLLAALAGVVCPDAGDISGTSGAAYLPEGFPLDPLVPVHRWLALASCLPGWSPALGGAIAADMGLDPRAPAGRLSQGQRVRLGLILTLGRDVSCYLLDDPFLGLDPVSRAHAERWIARRSESATVVLAAQDTDAVERLCTDLLLLHRGRVHGWGPIDEWRARFVAVRATGASAALAPIAGCVLRRRARGDIDELLLDDPDGQVCALLAAAGARVEPLPLRLDELISALVTT